MPAFGIANISVNQAITSRFIFRSSSRLWIWSTVSTTNYGRTFSRANVKGKLRISLIRSSRDIFEACWTDSRLR